MGKGKRNRQLHVENVAGAPQKRQSKSKKQFVWPLWAKRTLCIVLLVAVLAGIVVAALISSGAILRGRIIVESKSGKFDINQQMATFILWQAMYQQAANDWWNSYYQQYFGGSQSSIDFNTYTSAEQYGLAMASYYTKEALNSGLYSIKDYMIELVAGADAALDAGLKYEAHDKEDAKSVVTWMQNIYVSFGFSEQGIPFKNFLKEYVSDTIKTSDIEDAARVMVMYSKYSDYKSFELQGRPSDDDLQDFILKNPSNNFEANYYSYTGAGQDMIRFFFTDEFMTERFESTVAKHYANTDRLEIVDLKDDALNQKLADLELNNANKYTKSSDNGLPEAINDYIFSTSNKQGTFAAISGEKCAYLIYFKETSSATEATVAYKEYTFEKYKNQIVTDIADENLATIEAIKEALNASIVAGENTTDHKTDNEKAQDLLDKLKDGDVETGITSYETVDAKKGDTSTAPKSILDALFGEKAEPYEGWKFVVNDPNESYVVIVNTIADGIINISYVTYTDDPFAPVLRTFEAEFNMYLLESKVTAPTYTWAFDDFEKAVIGWLMDENFKELFLTTKANNERETIIKDKGADDEEKLKETLNTVFGEGGVKELKNTDYELKKNLDSAVYDHIFNHKNKDSVSVIVGKDDRVFLVYVETYHDNADDDGKVQGDLIITVTAGIKEFEFDAEDEAIKTLKKTIADALEKDRKAPADFAKPAEKIAAEELAAYKNTTDPKIWKGATKVDATLPLKENDTNTAPQAILDKVYPQGSSTTKIEPDLNVFYQADDNGTSYVFKLTEIDTEKKSCKIEYFSYEDEENYSYFRAIKDKLDASLKEKPTSVKHPSSITRGSYQDWLFKSEYKAAEGNNKASRDFERKKDDLTFIATTDSKNAITGLTIYIAHAEDEKPVVQQVYNEEKAIYAAYQLFKTEAEAQKALKKLNGKTGFELLDIFTSLKQTEEIGENNTDGYAAGYVITTSPTIGVDLTKSDVTDANLKAWLFDSNPAPFSTNIIAAKDGSGYYVAVFASAEAAWKRTARTGWVNEAFTEHMKTLVAGYAINEKAMAKVDGVITTATGA